MEKSAQKFVLGYAPDPRTPAAIDKLKAAVAIHGVRLCGELKDRILFGRDCFDNSLKELLDGFNLPPTLAQVTVIPC